MSVCTSVFITKEEAQKRVKQLLLAQYEEILDIAVQNMTNFDLTCKLSDEYYHYSIKRKSKVGE